jgi:phosphotransferase system enzyme I (PtsI)
VAVTGGYGMGPGFQVKAQAPRVSQRSIPAAQVRSEIQKFNRALNRAKRDLQAIRKRALRRLEGRVIEIFDAQILMLDDRDLYHHVTQAIRNEHLAAEWAYQRQVDVALQVLEKSRDEYLRQMQGDIGAVARRVIHYLQGLKQRTLVDLAVPSVLLADQLTPAELVQLPRELVLAIATLSGSRTDHTALVARSLGIPAVVGVRGELTLARKGERVLVDAEHGRVYFSPGPAQIALHRAHVRSAARAEREHERLAGKPAVTRDGHRISLKANLELLQEADFARTCGAEGVGLFRTEFLFLSGERLPDEATQLDAYRRLARRFKPHTVTLRVYDLGGDKLFYGHRTEDEPNPALGWRAVRLLLDRPALFRTQLRAMYRAAEFGNVRILFPMISSLAEWARVKEFALEVKSELEAEGLRFAAEVPLGAMIEIPALALEAERLAVDCDFFSVGTNDLTQYMLAVDRQNPLVASRFETLHPAVVKLLCSVVKAAKAHRRPVSLCGDLASDLHVLPLLVGIGFDELSTVPGAIPQIKAVIGDFTLVEAEELVQASIGETTARGIDLQIRRAWKRFGRRAGKKASR